MRKQHTLLSYIRDVVNKNPEIARKFKYSKDPKDLRELVENIFAEANGMLKRDSIRKLMTNIIRSQNEKKEN